MRYLSLLREANFKVILNSFLILYLELILIRLLPAYIYYFGYFTNLVLMASFLGIALGFLSARWSKNLIYLAPTLLFILLAAIRFITPGIYITNPEIVFFRSYADNSDLVLPPYVLLPALFIIIATIFAGMTQPLGKIFANSSLPLKTYLLDLIGALLGIVVFYLGSYFHLLPIVWLVIFSTLLLVLIWLISHKVILLLSFILLSLTCLISLDPDSLWSPYYQITLSQYGQVTSLLANRINHQFFGKLTDLPIYPLIYSQIINAGHPPEKILIIGSGTGQDTAAALSKGVGQIDAVEIDPTILQIGQKMHPEKPYSDPRVHLYNNDGRNFLKNTDKKYDLIIFAVTDSLIANSQIGQVRLESYLFTLESLQEVKSHLKEGGAFVTYNEYRRVWLVDRLKNMLEQTFGSSQVKTSLINVTMNLFRADKKELSQPHLMADNLPTDDWPFFYLKERVVPQFYWLTLGLILTISAVSLYLATGFKLIKVKGNLTRLAIFFLLGTAFSLLEAKSMAQLSLLFGVTWLVSALAFGGILLTALLAALITWKIKFKYHHLLMIVLIASLLIQYFIPPSTLLISSQWLKMILSLGYFYLPIFISSLLFADFFQESKLPATEFGANMLGLLLGAMAEYSALIAGYSALALIAASCYLLVFALSKTVKPAV